MEIEYLREFVKLAETRYYADAADALFISASSLTRHIQSLEKELGEALFIRTTRRVKLSEFGNKFLPFARQIVSIQDEYNDKLFVPKRREKEIIVGCIGGISPFKEKSWVNDFKRSQKGEDGVKITYISVSPKTQLELLRFSQCDFILTIESMVPKAEFNAICCSSDNLVVVVNEDHPLAHRKTVSLEELEAETLIVTEDVAKGDSTFMEACRERKITPHFKVKDGSNIIDYANMEDYIVIVARQPAEFFGNSGLSIIDIEPRIEEHRVIAYRKKPKLGVKEKEFLDFFINKAKEDGTILD